MALDARKIRRWIAGIAVAVILAVAGFYGYARYRISKELKNAPLKLAAGVGQLTKGFTFTKSEGGRRLFTISAGSGTQFTAGQRAELNDVRIIVFGRAGQPGADQGLYDQIYGKRFSYDPDSGDVTASGEVGIDLGNHGEPPSDPHDTKPSPGSIHLRTSGLRFNQKSGVAETRDVIEFSLPQAKGQARGARYDAKKMTLDLLSSVQVTATAEAARSVGVNIAATTLEAASASIVDRPVRAELHQVNLKQGDRSLSASSLALVLDAQNQVKSLVASGDVHGQRSGKAPADVRAGQIDFVFVAGSRLKTAKLTGGVTLEASAPNAMKARSQELDLDFGERNRVTQAHALGQVRLEQSGKNAQQFQLSADGMDFFLKPDGSLERASTSGKAALTTNDGASRNGTTTVSADRFDAQFDQKNHLRGLHGSPNASVVTKVPGQPDRVTTSRDVTAAFATGGDKAGQ